MNLIAQPTNSTCGQTCVAMIVDKPVAEVVKMFGHQRATTFKEVATALLRYGVKLKALRPTRSLLPPRALLSIELRVRGKLKRHWAVKWYGDVFDPACGRNVRFSADYKIVGSAEII